MVTMCSCMGSWSRYWATISLMSSPSRGTGKVAYGPTTELHDEKLSVSRYTSWISSYPVTATTPRCGSGSTGHCARSSSKYGYGSSTSDSSLKKSRVRQSLMRTAIYVCENGVSTSAEQSQDVDLLGVDDEQLLARIPAAGPVVRVGDAREDQVGGRLRRRPRRDQPEHRDVLRLLERLLDGLARDLVGA